MSSTLLKFLLPSFLLVLNSFSCLRHSPAVSLSAWIPYYHLFSSSCDFYPFLFLYLPIFCTSSPTEPPHVLLSPLWSLPCYTSVVLLIFYSLFYRLLYFSSSIFFSCSPSSCMCTHNFFFGLIFCAESKHAKMFKLYCLSVIRLTRPFSLTVKLYISHAPFYLSCYYN